MKIGRYDPYKLGYTCATIFLQKFAIMKIRANLEKKI